ncbi:putative Pre-mRNA-splicing factor ATP-dependent RNA helicase ddx-15 [Paratrimastix pyriformis]|uniref:RNA helicase n=1 Tax=Paratrimastix pyriformis TaxID=342808 RepID=A0ABQ8UQD0_9EUKA|nr:putative Pre-mRNA-splicing factor ATP-dependent RNA helicase ddx-15 [Paratrimastix pyriformis]
MLAHEVEDAPKTVFFHERKGTSNKQLDKLSKKELSRIAHDLLPARQQLPIYGARDEILREVGASDNLIIVGETGSGKTTQVPQFLYDTGLYTRPTPGSSARPMIAIVQPRRVAATSIARRVASEMGVLLGEEVGYAVRFDERMHRGVTALKYLTGGMLLREALLDPLLREYSVVILDEAHERTAQSDILLGLLKRIATRRAAAPKAAPGEQQPPAGGAPPGQPEEQPSSTPLCPLKLIVMSATLDAEKFASFLGGARTLHIRGRQFPVEVFYTGTPVTDYLDAATTCVTQLHRELPPGDMLVFLTGEEEIATVTTLLQERAASFMAALSHQVDPGADGRPDEDDEDGEAGGIPEGEQDLDGADGAIPAAPRSGAQGPAPKQAPAASEEEGLIGPTTLGTTLRMAVRPIYGALPFEKQQLVFEPAPPGTRKVILATNIAETSLTISGIRYVIDTGLVKQRAFHPHTGMDSLLVSPISRDAARQRAGRAGREAPGRCYRLYTEETYQKELQEHTVPEILRCNLAAFVLQLKCMGIEDVGAFDLIDRPTEAHLAQATATLVRLGALTPQGALAEPLGRQMAAFPLDPPFAKAIIVSQHLGCTSELLSITAMLSVENVFFTPPSEDGRQRALRARAQFMAPEGDHLTLLRAFEAYAATARLDLRRPPPRALRGLTGAECLPATARTRGVAHWCREHFLNQRSLERVWAVRLQLAGYCAQLGLNPGLATTGPAATAAVSAKDQGGASLLSRDPAPILKALLSGFPTHLAHRVPNQRAQYKLTTTSEVVGLHPTSSLLATAAARQRGARKRGSSKFKDQAQLGLSSLPESVLYTEYIITTRHYLRTVSAVVPEWADEGPQGVPMPTATLADPEPAAPAAPKQEEPRGAPAAAAPRRSKSKVEVHPTLARRLPAKRRPATAALAPRPRR